MSLEGKTKEEIEALAALADDVLSKPDTAGVFQRLVKKNNPNVSMPLIELEDKAIKAFGERDKQIAALQGQVQQSEAEKLASVLLENLRDAGVVKTRAEFNDLVKWASDNGFMTTETGLRKAAQQRAYEKEAAEPTPSTVTSGSLMPDKKDDWMKDPIGTARRKAAEAMEDIRKARQTGKALR